MATSRAMVPAVSDSFLEERLSGIPSWLPDETFFSFCSRLHRRSGNALSSTTAKLLFGSVRKGLTHDFPSGLEAFVQRTGGILGTASEICLWRSLPPYYLALRDDNDRVAILEQAVSSSATHLKMKLGLPAGRFRAHHPLKACLQCIDCDERKYGETYWHLTHQIPGVCFCPLHRTVLLESTVKANGVERFLWALPTSSQLRSVGGLAQRDSVVRQDTGALVRLGEAAIGLTEYGRSDSLDLRGLRRLYLSKLQDAGLASHSGRLHIPELRRGYSTFVQQFENIESLQGLFFGDTTFDVSRCFRPARGHMHPLRPLSVVIWLFESWDRFLEEYQRFPSGERPPLKTIAIPPTYGEHTGRNEALALVGNAGYSPSAAARKIGADVSTVQAWLASVGITSAHRPKTFSADKRIRAVQFLENGRSKRYVAKALGISEQSVTRLLRTEVGLRNRWLRATEEERRTRAREAWMVTTEMYGGLPIRIIRQMAGADYAWLYRHDRQWLQETSGNETRSARLRKSIVDWPARDRDISSRIEKAALEIHEASGKVTVSRLCQSLPDLRAKLSQIGHLPMVKLTLRKLTKRSKT